MDTPKRGLARSFRRRMPVNEERLWRLLRDRRLDGVKFRRQVPIGPYIADFVSFRHRLIVEADGPLHDAERDAIRDAWLAGQGFRVLRFANRQVEVWPDRVLDTIRARVGLDPIYRGPLVDDGRVD